MTVIHAGDVGVLLRGWRERRRLSQLELSARAHVSTRHLSFVETGRSKPTREMLDRLSAHLDIPLRERNQLLLSAGFAPAHPERAMNAPELRSVSSALRQLLDAHAQYPALVLDRWWDVMDRNAATDVLLEGCALHLLEPPVNAVRLSLHPEGLAPRIRNLGQWRTHLIGQVCARADRTGDSRLRRLAEEVAAYPGDDVGRPAVTDVVIPLELEVAGEDLRFFSMSAAVESALDITIDELRIESFYPADDATARCLRHRQPS
ncbi:MULTISPECIES: helix-turn-helix domain-containing protein [Microbacterium]|uniref:helix-turn-helix domain-containing protein n=1 Tax=Microbacterium TaxID=33882 RepID=UPI00049367C0|nr:MULTISPECIES: helix-turn-helix transcriptional regulator [unclassified Microbacterium]